MLKLIVVLLICATIISCCIAGGWVPASAFGMAVVVLPIGTLVAWWYRQPVSATVEPYLPVWLSLWLNTILDDHMAQELGAFAVIVNKDTGEIEEIIF